MATYVVSFSIAVRLSEPEPETVLEGRYWKLAKEVFAFGPAWQGPQRSIFLRSEMTADQILQRLDLLLEGDDLAIVAEVNETNVRWAGQRFDHEGFNAVFPSAAGSDDRPRTRSSGGIAS